MSRFDFYQDTRQEWRWRFVARNGRIMADSAEGYVTEQGAREGAARFKELAATAEILMGAPDDAQAS